METQWISFQDELLKIAQGVPRQATPSLRVPRNASAAGVYQAARASQYGPHRRLGTAIRRGQKEYRVGKLTGGAAGGLGAYGLMRHLVPKGGKLGILGRGLGALGGYGLGRGVGGATGGVMAHKRLMKASPVRGA